MDEKEAKEKIKMWNDAIDKSFIENQPIPLSNAIIHLEAVYSAGYLEAIEKAIILESALRKIHKREVEHNGSGLTIQTVAIALAEWENDK